jgi:hypothetical protein
MFSAVTNRFATTATNIAKFTCGLAVLTFALGRQPVAAQDVAVLWDVSGSIKALMGDPPYSADLRRSVAGVVLGQGISTTLWKVTSPPSLTPELGRVLDRESPLPGQGHHVLVLRFGRFERERYPSLPYFQSEDFPVDNLEQLETRMLRAFPERANEGYTNKDLAMAAASRYLYERGSTLWYLVIISDFNEDHIEKLNPTEMQVVDDFTTGRFADRTSPIVMRWAQNPGLKLLVEVDKRRDAPALPAAPRRVPQLELISPRAKAKLSADRRPVFCWKWNAERPANGFVVVVTRLNPAGLTLSKSTESTCLTADKPFSPARYSWQVFADNGSVASAPVPFEVKGTGGGLQILLSLAALGGALWLIWYWKNKRRRAEGRA